MSGQKLQFTVSVTLAPGASIDVVHGLRTGDLCPLVPNRVWPDRATPIGCTAHDDVKVTLTNPLTSAAEETAEFTILCDHSIQRDFLTDPSECIWKGTTEGSSSLFGAALQDQYGVWLGPFDAPAPSYTLDGELSEFDVYIRSNFLQSTQLIVPGDIPGEPAESMGNDTVNSGLTKARPLQSLQGLYKRFPMGFRDDAKLRVHLAGKLAAPAADNGFDSQASSPMAYRTSFLWLGGGHPNEQSYSYEGPKGMWAPSPGILGNLTAFAAVGAPALISQLTFSGVFGAETLEFASFLRITKPDGNRRVSEMPIFKNDGAGHVFMAEGGYAAFGLYDVTYTYEVVRPAAWISASNADGSSDFGGVIIQGYGNNRYGWSAADANAINPRWDFTRLAIAGPIARCSASFDRCATLDHPTTFYSDVLFYSSRADQNVFMYGGSKFLGVDTAPNEYAAHADSALNPQFPQIGVDLHIGRGGNLFLGGKGMGSGLDAGGHHSGHCRFFKTLSLSTGAGLFGGIYMTDHSSLYQDDNGFLIVDGANVGLWVWNKAEARLKDGRVLMQNNITADLRSEATNETLANWANAAIWNKNFCTFQPYTPANKYGAGVPAANIYPLGCVARIYE